MERSPVVSDQVFGRMNTVSFFPTYIYVTTHEKFLSPVCIDVDQMTKEALQ
jgi:hypothetical protein